MNATSFQLPDGSQRTNATWDIVQLFPDQGEWTEEEYLSLPGNRLVEMSDGRIEVLPWPTCSHQSLVGHLFVLFHGWISDRSLGHVLMAPLPVRLCAGTFREPDVLFLAARHRSRAQQRFWDGADLVMEVVSEADPERDRNSKRIEYAKAAIPEYWIVDPQSAAITVLRLGAGKYDVHGHFVPGQIASSHLIPGFNVDVAAAFAAAEY